MDGWQPGQRRIRDPKRRRDRDHAPCRHQHRDGELGDLRPGLRQRHRIRLAERPRCGSGRHQDRQHFHPGVRHGRHVHRDGHQQRSGHLGGRIGRRFPAGRPDARQRDRRPGWLRERYLDRRQPDQRHDPHADAGRHRHQPPADHEHGDRQRHHLRSDCRRQRGERLDRRPRRRSRGHQGRRQPDAAPWHRCDVHGDGARQRTGHVDRRVGRRCASRGPHVRQRGSFPGQLRGRHLDGRLDCERCDGDADHCRNRHDTRCPDQHRDGICHHLRPDRLQQQLVRHGRRAASRSGRHQDRRRSDTEPQRHRHLPGVGHEQRSRRRARRARRRRAPTRCDVAFGDPVGWRLRIGDRRLDRRHARQRRDRDARHRGQGHHPHARDQHCFGHVGSV